MGDGIDAYTALSAQITALERSLDARMSSTDSQLSDVRKDVREIRDDVRKSKASTGQLIANMLISVAVAFITVWLTSMGIHTPGSGKVSNGNI